MIEKIGEGTYGQVSTTNTTHAPVALAWMKRQQYIISFSIQVYKAKNVKERSVVAMKKMRVHSDKEGCEIISPSFLSPLNC